MTKREIDAQLRAWALQDEHHLADPGFRRSFTGRSANWGIMARYQASQQERDGGPFEVEDEGTR